MRPALPVLTVSAVLLVALAGCGSSSPKASASNSSAPSASSTHVVVGSANFSENEILGDIYADALKDKGVSVTVKSDIGSREIYYPELKNGTLTLFPEYNGALLDYLNASATASSTSAVDAALAKELPSSLEELPSAAAQDSDSVTVTSAFAKAHHLTSIAQLKPLESQITFGAAPEFATREVGLPGLKKLYGIKFKGFDPLDESGPLVITALRTGKIQAADIYTTDPAVSQYHFVPLADPKHLFAAQNITPIINKKVATPLVTSTIEAVDKVLTTSVLEQLVAGNVNDHVDPNTIAKDFLHQAGLS